MATITSLQSTDDGATSRGVINTNFTNLNSDKAETTSPTFATSITGSYLTASEVLITDDDKKIVSAPVATYPSLTELSYVKGLSSAVQTQLNAKASLTGEETLTNKTLIATTNVVEEITTTASSATPTPTGGSLRNLFTVTALAADATFAAPSGTPANGNYLTIRIKDNGTARTLAFNAIYRAIGITLPTTTVISKTMYIGCRYNSADSKWDVLAYGIEA